MFLLMIMLISDQSLLSAYMYLPTLRVALKGAVSWNSAKLGIKITKCMLHEEKHKNNHLKL